MGPAPVQLELLCNGYAVPNDLTLAALRTFVWKRTSPNMEIYFRYLDPAHPAPPPELKPA